MKRKGFLCSWCNKAAEWKMFDESLQVDRHTDYACDEHHKTWGYTYDWIKPSEIEIQE